MKRLPIFVRVFFALLSLASFYAATRLGKITIFDNFNREIMSMVLLGLSFWFLAITFQSTLNISKMILKAVSAITLGVYFYRSLYIDERVSFSLDSLIKDSIPVLFFIVPLIACCFIDDESKITIRAVKEFIHRFFKGGIEDKNAAYGVDIYFTYSFFIIESILSILIGVIGLVCRVLGLMPMSFIEAHIYTLDRGGSIILGFIKAVGMALSADYVKAFLIVGVNLILVIICGVFYMMTYKRIKIGFNPFLGTVALAVLGILLFYGIDRLNLKLLFYEVMEFDGILDYINLLRQWPGILVSYKHLGNQDVLTNIAFYISFFTAMIPLFYLWSSVHYTSNIILRLFFRSVLLAVFSVAGYVKACLMGSILLNIIRAGIVIVIVAIGIIIIISYITSIMTESRIREIKEFDSNVLFSMDHLNPYDKIDREVLREIADDDKYGLAANYKAKKKLNEKD